MNSPFAKQDNIELDMPKLIPTTSNVTYTFVSYLMSMNMYEPTSKYYHDLVNAHTIMVNFEDILKQSVLVARHVNININESCRQSYLMFEQSRKSFSNIFQKYKKDVSKEYNIKK